MAKVQVKEQTTDTVKARVLLDVPVFGWHAGDVVTVNVSQLAEVEGWVDTHPDAVSYAEQVLREREEALKLAQTTLPDLKQ